MTQVHFKLTTKLDLAHKLEHRIRAWMVGHQLEFEFSFPAILNMLHVVTIIAIIFISYF